MCTVLAFWKAPSESILSQIPSDRGATILELAALLRKNGLNVELATDDRRLDRLKGCVDAGAPGLLIVELTAGPDIPVSPVLRPKGYPHFLVVSGYDDSSRVVQCLGLGPEPVKVPYKRLAQWWKRTGYAFLKVTPGKGTL